MWTIIRSRQQWQSIESADDRFWGIRPPLVNGVLVIEEDEEGWQRARFATANRSYKVDLAWAWGQFDE
jgi:hypothetical protein